MGRKKREGWEIERQQGPPCPGRTLKNWVNVAEKAVAANSTFAQTAHLKFLL